MHRVHQPGRNRRSSTGEVTQVHRDGRHLRHLVRGCFEGECPPPISSGVALSLALVEVCGLGAEPAQVLGGDAGRAIPDPQGSYGVSILSDRRRRKSTGGGAPGRAGRPLLSAWFWSIEQAEPQAHRQRVQGRALRPARAPRALWSLPRNVGGIVFETSSKAGQLRAPTRASLDTVGGWPPLLNPISIRISGLRTTGGTQRVRAARLKG